MSRADDTLASGAQRILGRDLTQPEREHLDNYLNILKKWQRIHRLAGSDDREWAVRNLILDSFLFLLALPGRLSEQSDGAVLDLGSGAGVPGVPLAIVTPHRSFVLVEARQRRASFLAAAVRSLGLRNCQVIAERAESAANQLAGRFDAVVMRCAGDTDALIPLAKRFLIAGGVIIVSGPPKARAISTGRWVEVPGIEPGSTRRFLVAP